METKSILIGAGVFGLVGGLASVAMPGVVERWQADAAARAKVEASATYSGCRAAQQSGVTPLHAGEPGYRSDMDGDGDGIACEDY